MNRILKAVSVVAAMVALMGGCAASSGTMERASLGADVDLIMQPTVMVQNQEFSDVTVYVVSDNVERRLGIVTGVSTERLVLPAGVLGTQVRFYTRSIGNGETRVSNSMHIGREDAPVLTVSGVGRQLNLSK